MSTEYSGLFSLARSKLHLFPGSKDNCSLHKWVLLKNSIIRCHSSIAASAGFDNSEDNSVCSLDEHGDGDDEDVGVEDDADSFMFPDASNLVECGGTDANVSEAEWLDSLLERMYDDGDDEFNTDSDIRGSLSSADDDEDQQSSPSISPLSSSDDLLSQNAYFPSPIAVPYPVPYPPFHPPLVSYELGPYIEAPLHSISYAYDDPLPYYDADDVDDLPVPDAIEDTSDDESDAPVTPSLDLSLDRSAALSIVDPASIPLPSERRRTSSQPHVYTGPADVYIRPADSFFYPYEIDPLPFSEDHQFTTYNPVYSEC